MQLPPGRFFPTAGSWTFRFLTTLQLRCCRCPSPLPDLLAFAFLLLENQRADTSCAGTEIAQVFARRSGEQTDPLHVYNRQNKVVRSQPDDVATAAAASTRRLTESTKKTRRKRAPPTATPGAGTRTRPDEVRGGGGGGDADSNDGVAMTKW